MRLLSKFLLIFSLLLSQSWAAETTTIAAFGDSLFAGYGLGAQDAFPIKLENTLKAEGYNVRVLNQAISGDTTAGGLGRVDYVLSHKPDIVILELGGNDLLRGFPADTIYTNLDAILAKLHQAGVKIILAGHVAPLNYGVQYAEDYNAIFPSLAGKYGVALYPSILDGLLGNPALLQPDGVHPTPAGVDLIVAGMAPLVKQML